MKTVLLKDLAPGMRVGVDIYNDNQLILLKNTVLTAEMIERIKNYNIPYVKIVVEDLKDTQKFKVFKQEFIQNVSEIQGEFNDVVTKNTPIKIDNLLEKTASVLSKAEGTNIFDMLRNMRNYDDSTYVHCLNVALICNVMGKWMNLPAREMETLVLAGMLHDIGKLTIPDAIIKKPGKLTDDEFNIIKTHPVKGFEILRNQKLPEAVKYATLMHHERCDGTGYPLGISYEKIDPIARLVSIADVYDAMTSNRVYRDSLSPFTVVDIFQKEGLQKYDPEYILMFLERIVNTYLNNHVQLSDGRTGEVVLINQHALSRPLLRVENGFLDLSQEKDITITRVLS